MIVIDTNVLSALMRVRPDAPLVEWLDEQPEESIWITSVTLFEAKLGLELLPRGKRRRALEDAFTRLIEQDLDNRVLTLDAGAAVEAASLAARRQRAGKPVDMRDTLIAGIATSHNAVFATRNGRHFDDLTIPVVNPWDSQSSLR
jgi:predicted nucleic acid-binding protein